MRALYALSAISVALGLLMLMGVLLNPPLDKVAFVRDLATSLLAISVGAIAVPLYKKFKL